MQGFPPPIDKRVSRTNALFTPPYNHWSYLNMRTIYPTAGFGNADKASNIDKSIDTGIAGLRVKKTGGDQLVNMDTYMQQTSTVWL